MPSASLDAPLADGLNHEHSVTLHYRTGWSRPLLHYSVDNGATWSSEEFHPAKISPVGPDFRVAMLDMRRDPPRSQHAGAVQFVMTDGNGAWDNPSADCHADFVQEGSRNYRVTSSGVFVLYEGCLSRHDRAMLKTPALTLVTDIDGTLYGNDDGLRRFYNLWCRHLALSGAFLIFNTGRSLESAVELLLANRKLMPVPVAIVSRVGSHIHWLRPPSFDEQSVQHLHHEFIESGLTNEWIDIEVSQPVPDRSWRASLARVEGLDHFRCKAILHSVIEAAAPDPKGHWLCEDVALDEPFHLSVAVRTEYLESVLEELREKLQHYPVKFITSGDSFYRYLDVTTSSAGKLGASVHVTKILPGDGSHAVFCGDSGNDADALQGDLKGVVVANAQPDLLDFLEKWNQANTLDSKSFKVVRATQACADGIICGLRQHGFL